jgi:hypothetical protein
MVKPELLLSSSTIFPGVLSVALSMFGDNDSFRIKKLRQVLLCEPYRFAFEPDIQGI